MVVTSHPYRNYHKGPGAPFIKGPVPLSWMRRAIAAAGTASDVGLYLWHLKGLRRTHEDLVVTRKGAWDKLGIGRFALARGLTRLETAGLIVITSRGVGKAIRVTISEVPLA